MKDIKLTAYQATIFKTTEDLFSSIGYRGEDLFEDTYVLQKKLVDYVVSSVSLNRGSETDSIVAKKVYNAVLGISKKVITDVGESPTTAPSTYQPNQPNGTSGTKKLPISNPTTQATKY